VRTYQNLRDYQRNKIIPHIVNHPSSMVWAFMGAGKTVSVLTAFTQLQDVGLSNKMLVFAPLRVAEGVWEEDAREWDYLKHLRFSKLLGSPKNRLRELFRTDVDVWLINYEKMVWLVEVLRKYFVSKNKPLPFDIVVYDEVTKCKNSGTNRVKAWRHLTNLVHRKCGLTGTPASNGLKDLFGQYLVVDDGERFGTSKTAFRDKFFYQVGQYADQIEMYPSAPDKIRELISDITIQLKEEDYLQLPPFSYNDLWVDLPPKLRAQYDQLERDLFVELDNAVELNVVNKAALSNKCLQFANGCAYINPGEPEAVEVHDLKLEAMDEILEEVGDSNILVMYAFKTDAERLLKRYPFAVNISGYKGKQFSEIQERWNRGEIRMLIGHPQSMGHGLNLQRGAHHMATFGLTWSLEQFNQWIKRIHRQGQENPVICHRILMRDTVEVAQLAALEKKHSEEQNFREAVAEYRRQRGI